MFSRSAARFWPLYVFILLFFLLCTQENLSFVEGNAHTIKDRRHRHGFHSIDSIFVVNLESRADRLEHINGVLGSLGLSLHHKIVHGVPHSCGVLGCTLSHVMALSECMDSNATTCAIFEDDFELSCDPEEANAAVERFFRNEPQSWQMLMLSAHVLSSSPSEFSHVEVINQALTGSGYIVHTSFAPMLLHLFLQAAYRLNQESCSQTLHAPDVLWGELQQSGKWFALKPLIGKQRASYSDIEKRVVDYKVKMRLH
jgi:GR25 family glycosyltransferase involved in LPS biosynthesis